MTGPISNPTFDHDYPKFIYQTPDVANVNPHLPRPKPFNINSPKKSEKPKKDEKEKPFKHK